MTALAPRVPDTTPEAENIIAGLDIQQIGALFAKSGYFADAREASQCIVKVLAGREMGIGPFQSMTGIHLIQGKPSLHYTLMGAQLRRTGRYDYRVKRLDDSGCAIEFFDRGQPIGVSEFGVREAAQAMLGGGVNYKKYPRNMFIARALSNGIRWYCPDALGGPVYVPEELGGGEIEPGGTADAQPPAPRMKKTTDLNAELGIDQPAAPLPEADDVPASITTPDIVDAEQAQQPVVPPPLDAGEQARKDLASAARAWCGIPAADLPVVALINSIARAMGLSMPPAGERYSDAQIKLMADWVAAKVAKKIDYTKATTPA